MINMLIVIYVTLSKNDILNIKSKNDETPICILGYINARTGRLNE